MTTNATEMMRALNLLLQVAPLNLWGEALHTSGLFEYILTTLIEGEVSIVISCHLSFILIVKGLNNFTDRTCLISLASGSCRSKYT